MDSEEDWESFLRDHAIFELPRSVSDPERRGETSLELSLSTLADLNRADAEYDGAAPSGRRQVMAIKESDLVVATGSEIRMASLTDAKLGKTGRKTFKTLHTPNITFEIRQMALNPNGKLLAVAGTFEVAVIILPRNGFIKLVSATVDAKAVQVGQYYHGADNASPVVKIDWHPWGESGSTLLVMTANGKFREYDISVDAEEPQQVLSFVPEQKKSAFLAEDPTEREVASFSLGKGRADWGPLTVYAVMRSGDVYAMCPYMPRNAAIPSSYVHALECFVAAKQEYLTSHGESSSEGMSMIYEYQQKYVSAMLRQLPPGTSFPAASRYVTMHPPNTIKTPPLRQGPFLLQPAPRTLEGSEGGDATDIAYLNFGADSDDANDDTERLGIVLVSFQDGKVDVYLDVEKVEARWERRQGHAQEFPMLAVYESIDLGLVDAVTKASSSGSQSLLPLLQGNHPILYPDAVNEEAIYVYHAFGVHVLRLGPMLRSLTLAIRIGCEGDVIMQETKPTDVVPILLTFSVERKSSSPVIGVSIPGDVYLTYSLFVLTSAMRTSVFPLILAPEPESVSDASLTLRPSSRVHTPKLPAASDGPPAYVSLLGEEPFKPSSASDNTSFPTSTRLSLPLSATKGEFVLTAETLRYLGNTVEMFMGQIHEVQLAHRAAEARAELQEREFARQRETCQEMFDLVEKLTSTRQAQTKDRLKKLQETQKKLSSQLDRTLQGLLMKASPDLSEHETKWFEELRRMKQEVAGASKYDDRSLASRAKQLKKEVDRLLPGLYELEERELERKKRAVENGQVLGLSQAFELGERSSAERVKISDLESAISKLAVRLDLTLGRPPQSKTSDL